jgi:hypothetical protein
MWLSTDDNYWTAMFCHPPISLTLYKTHHGDTFQTNRGTRSIVTLQFGSDFAVWQLTRLWLPGQNIKCRHATVSLENTVLFSTFFTVISYSHKVPHSHIIRDGSGGCILATNQQLIVSLSFPVLGVALTKWKNCLRKLIYFPLTSKYLLLLLSFIAEKFQRNWDIHIIN